MNTTIESPKPRRVGVVMAILGMWLKETNHDLTPEEKVRAKYYCRAKLEEARARYGGTPPIDVLLSIDEATALQILSYRETMQTLARTSPLHAHEQTPVSPDGSQGETGGKGKPPNAAPARARASEFDPLYKSLEHARKARKDVEDLVKNVPKTAKSFGGISPEALAIAQDKDIMSEILARTARRNAADPGPPEPGGPINVPPIEEYDP